jgi:hypothetical protein
MRIKYFLTILLAIAMLSPAFSNAEVGDYQAGSYLFHLYFDNGQLVADRDFQFKYDIETIVYAEPTLVTGFPYRGEIINFVNEIAANFKFDPRNGDAKFNKGKISVRAPYVADAQKVVFYDNQNQPVLTIAVSDSSFCNDDGICNADRGEDILSCPRDCKAGTPLPSVIPTSTGGTSGLILGVIYSIVGVVLIVGLWWLFRKRGSGGSLPPPPSDLSLPTPPTPPSQNNPV